MKKRGPISLAHRIEPKCCDMAGLVIRWETLTPNWTSGPSNTGWTIAYDMTHAVNVSFCPFCGAKLTDP